MSNRASTAGRSATGSRATNRFPTAHSNSSLDAARTDYNDNDQVDLPGSDEDVDSDSESDSEMDLWGCAPVQTRSGATIAKPRSGGVYIHFAPVTPEVLANTSFKSGSRKRGQSAAKSRSAGNGDTGLKFKFFKSETRLIRAMLEEHGFQDARSGDDWNVLWAGTHLKPYTLQSLGKNQRVNHFPRTFEITRKDRLYHNISRMRELHGAKHFGFIPQTFSLPGEFNEFYSEYTKDKYMYWIVKPNTLSRGRGIFITNNIHEVPVDENCVISRYIQNPLLVDGFKFDIRLYVCITSFCPLRFYIHEEGLVRFATERFSSHSRFANNAFMHLTNYSINKKNSNFVSNEDADVDDYGNKWSLSALKRYFERVGIDHERIWQQWDDIITKTLISIESSVHSGLGMFVPFSRKNCFELLGFDILLDDQYRAWLLEVNLSPSLSCDTPLDHKIKNNVVADMFNLVGLRKNKSARATSAAYGSTTGPDRHGLSSQPRATSGRYAGEELNALRETADEWVRSLEGGFRRVFPTPTTNVYTTFFERPRRLNTLLREWFFPGPAPTRGPFSSLSYSRGLSHSVRGTSASSRRPLSAIKGASSTTSAASRQRRRQPADGQEKRRASAANGSHFGSTRSPDVKTDGARSSMEIYGAQRTSSPYASPGQKSHTDSPSGGGTRPKTTSGNPAKRRAASATRPASHRRANGGAPGTLHQAGAGSSLPPAARPNRRTRAGGNARSTATGTSTRTLHRTASLGAPSSRLPRTGGQASRRGQSAVARRSQGKRGSGGLSYAKLNLSDLTVTPNQEDWQRIQSSPGRGRDLAHPQNHGRSNAVNVPDTFKAVIAEDNTRLFSTRTDSAGNPVGQPRRGIRFSDRR